MTTPSSATEQSDADDLFYAMYAEWLMAQPDAGVCNGDTLVKRMEQGWGLESFIGSLPERMEREVRRYFEKH